MVILYYTPYSFSGNKVIDHVELEGLEAEVIIYSKWYANKIEALVYRQKKELKKLKD